MKQRVFRSRGKPRRIGLSWDELWKGPDTGLITCWEVGRAIARKEPELAERARNGELPVLGWKGGIEKTLKTKEKYGTLYYLAQWQGLRGDDLDIDLLEETDIECSRTGMKVVFTGDSEKYCNA